MVKKPLTQEQKEQHLKIDRELELTELQVYSENPSKEDLEQSKLHILKSLSLMRVEFNKLKK